MTSDQHAAIFSAYIGRMSLSQIRNIVAAVEQSWEAQMNLGTRAQLMYVEDEEAVVRREIAKCLPADLANIEREITRQQEKS